MKKLKEEFYKSACKLELAIINQIGDLDEIFEYPQNYARADGGVSGFIYNYEIQDFFNEWATEIIIYWEEVCKEFDIEKKVPKNFIGDAILFFVWFVLENTISKIILLKEDLEEDV